MPRLPKPSALILATATVALAACGDSSTGLSAPSGPTTPGGNGGDTPPPSSACPAGTTEVNVGTSQVCELAGTITQDITLTAGMLYQLNGQVIIGSDTGADASAPAGNPAVLTINPGVTIYGATSGDTLVISRGSQIMASGTASNPITFTSAADVGLADDLGLPARQAYSGPTLSEPFTAEWGGIQINGRATVNNCPETQPNDPGFNASAICEQQGEGNSGAYGGNDDNDSSGTLRYVRVLYAGSIITGTDELNGIGFQGVGRGTTIEFLQVHNGADDGIEFFGGTADMKNVVITGADDDSLDWTAGWRGRVQDLIIIHNPSQGASDQGIEADNNGSQNDFLPRAQPVLANMTIIGAAAEGGASDIGILLREGTGANIFNTVVDNFGDGCLDIDNTPTFLNAGTPDALTGALTIESTLLGCETPFVDDGNDFDLAAFFNGQPNNRVGATSLSGGFINGSFEAAVTATNLAAQDSFFDSRNYIGAVRSSAPTANWTLGWTIGLNADTGCPAGTTENDAGCVLSGTITQDIRLTAGQDYFLDGVVRVGVDMGADSANPLPTGVAAALRVDAGVTVQAMSGSSALFVARGSQLITNGTAAAPVVFTAQNPTSRNLDIDTALWGGIALNGRATVNNCPETQPNDPGFNASAICEQQGEGNSGAYGGNDDNDSSGQLLYTRVEFAGQPVTSTDELNGIAFQGVGRGTNVNYLQVHNGADDGVEFFGGTVDVKHLVITGADDDSLDWTAGWRGRGQHILIVHNPNQAAADQGIEADNNGSQNDFLPRAQPVLANMTIIGAAAEGGASDIGILLREGTGANIFNTVVDNFGDGCLDIDNTPTFLNAGTPDALTGALTIESTLLGCETPFVDDGNDFDLAAFFNGQPNNSVGATSLAPRAGGTIGYINAAAEAGIAATNLNAQDNFFDPVGEIGAVPASGPDWTLGWTVYLDR